MLSIESLVSLIIEAGSSLQAGFLAAQLLLELCLQVWLALFLLCVVS